MMDVASFGRYESLEVLTDTITTQSEVLKQALATAKAQPSLRDSDPNAYPLDQINDEVVQCARNLVAEAARQLHALAIGPKPKLFVDGWSLYHTANVYRIIHLYKVAENVPLQGSIPLSELSQIVGLDQGKLTRVLRMAQVDGLFWEPQPEQLAHTAASRLLAESSGARCMLGHCVDEMFPAAAALPEAWNKYGSTRSDPKETAFTMANFNPDHLSIFDFYQTNEQAEQRFGGAMQYLSAEVAHGNQEVLDSFDWQSLGKATVVDCGASRGDVMRSVLEAHPALCIDLQDLPSVIEQAKEHPFPSNLADQVTYTPYNFLEQIQPNKDADVYYFRQVFHDWPDKECHQILQNLLPSMKKASKLVINDRILLPPGQGAYVTERDNRIRDLQMLLAVNSKERDLNEWKALIAAGSAGALRFESAKDNFVVYSKI